MYIGGEWVQSQRSEVYTARNPATGEPLVRVQKGTRADVQDATDRARAVQPELGSMTAFERGDLCYEIADAIEASVDWLAEWLVRDQEKPLHEAHHELTDAVNNFRNAGAYVKHDAFLDGLVEWAESIALGDPLTDGTDMGPLNNEEVASKMDRHIEDATAHGATVRTGGTRATVSGSSLYYEPTVIDAVDGHGDVTQPIPNERGSASPASRSWSSIPLSSATNRLRSSPLLSSQERSKPRLSTYQSASASASDTDCSHYVPVIATPVGGDHR